MSCTRNAHVNGCLKRTRHSRFPIELISHDRRAGIPARDSLVTCTRKPCRKTPAPAANGRQLTPVAGALVR